MINQWRLVYKYQDQRKTVIIYIYIIQLEIKLRFQQVNSSNVAIFVLSCFFFLLSALNYKPSMDMFCIV